jgi:nitrite reductase/ring-hydroxylating ferredoxin subunit
MRNSGYALPSIVARGWADQGERNRLWGEQRLTTGPYTVLDVLLDGLYHLTQQPADSLLTVRAHDPRWLRWSKGSRAGAGIAKEANLAPGSAVAFTDAGPGKPTVLAHLKNGEFVAYSAECTHHGCTVSYRAKGDLACPCCRSVFDPVNGGEVVSGLAEESLPRLRIKLRNGRIFRAERRRSSTPGRG